MKYYFFDRESDGTNPGGVTVSKISRLPAGDFAIDEYIWPNATLWFVSADAFSECERQEACEALNLLRRNGAAT